MGIDLAIDAALSGWPVAWFSPTYKMLIDIWRDLTELVRPYVSRKNVQERRVELVTGGVIDMWSLESPDTARGRKYARAIVDEAAIVPVLMSAWQHVIRPMLIDFQGDAFFLSTPKGRNAFWQMYQWGVDDGEPEWSAWKLPTWTNPLIQQGEIDAMKRTMPENIFNQEIQADFIDDFGGVFQRVMEAATAEPLARGEDGGHYVIGADWGRQNDFTVFVVIDAQKRRMVHMERFTQIDYNIQASRLKALSARFPGHIVAEYNAMGGPIVERLQMEGLPVQGFVTTGGKTGSKEQIIRALESAFSNGEIAILNDPVLVGELQAYEQEQLPAGGWKFGAPEGMHDDTVIALALAWSGIAAGDLVLW